LNIGRSVWSFLRRALCFFESFAHASFQWKAFDLLGVFEGIDLRYLWAIPLRSRIAEREVAIVSGTKAVGDELRRELIVICSGVQLVIGSMSG
jgi:hypothetical protein